MKRAAAAIGLMVMAEHANMCAGTGVADSRMDWML